MGLLYTDQLTWTLRKVLTNYNFEKIKNMYVLHEKRVDIKQFKSSVWKMKILGLSFM